MTHFTNQTFDQISLGETVTVAHTVTRDEVELLALVSGDANPFADCDALADGTEPLPRCDGVSAEALVHGVLKRRLPGPGTVIVAHALTYAGQAHVGDELMATVTVTDKQAPDRVVLACQVRRGEDVLVDGHVTVQAPSAQRTVDERESTNVVLRRHDVFGRLFRQCEHLPPVTCAVVHPCDRDSLAGPLEAARHGLITPVLANADRTDLYTLSRSWADLVSRARSKQLKPEEYSTGTFTLSNLGMFGVDRFDAILPPGTGAILAVAASRPRRRPPNTSSSQLAPRFAS